MLTALGEPPSTKRGTIWDSNVIDSLSCHYETLALEG